MAFAYALYGVLDALRVNAWVLFAAYCFLNFTLSFGPNVTTFVLPAATFSGDTKSTMNGLCAALGKLGAVVGTQVLPVLLDLGLSYVLGACLVTCVAGALLTQVCVEAKAYETVLLEADAGEGAEVALVEEFAGAAGFENEAYWANGVCEIRVGENARVTHSMVQAQSRRAVHTRATHVTQAERSEYSLAEVNVGGAIGRHDLTVTQLGPRTSTNLACFNLAGAGQCLDLHSAVTLDHEEGKTDQVHKCIASHATGRGVFDGNVRVNKAAQRTDAGQISRNLLLVPKATVNVKPNLQIVADDVVCTHGCTVSDLEEEELFYIQSRGLSPATARSALSTSCGPPGESATATPLYASNAAKFMDLYGQTRRRFMALPRQNPRVPSAAITLRNAAPTGSDDRFSWYSSLIRSMGARSVRTTTVLSTPAARRSAVFRASPCVSSVGF